MFGYQCTLLTDTEVITYIIDYLVRKQGLTMEEAAQVIAAPFWSAIDNLPPQARDKKMCIRDSHIAPGRNGYKAGQRAVKRHGNLRLFVAHPGDAHGSDRSDGGCQVGGHKDRTHAGQGIVARGT